MLQLAKERCWPTINSTAHCHHGQAKRSHATVWFPTYQAWLQLINTANCDATTTSADGTTYVSVSVDLSVVPHIGVDWMGLWLTRCGVVLGRPGQALQDLYTSSNGEQWQNNENWLLGDPCMNRWHGVTCSAGGLSVSQLSLAYNNLQGSLPASLSNFSQIAVLYVDLSTPISDDKHHDQERRRCRWRC
jgi:hypothetical protein